MKAVFVCRMASSPSVGWTHMFVEFDERTANVHCYLEPVHFSTQYSSLQRKPNCHIKNNIMQLVWLGHWRHNVTFFLRSLKCIPITFHNAIYPTPALSRYSVSDSLYLKPCVMMLLSEGIRLDALNYGTLYTYAYWK